MVDPILTYLFAALFFVALLGSMLYLTFMDQPIDDEAELGKSVVGGAGAQERSDDLETGELAATTESDDVTEPRDDEQADAEEEAAEGDAATDEEAEDTSTESEAADEESTDAAADDEE